MATTVIPASNFINISISLDVPAGTPVNFQRALLLSDEEGFVKFMMGDESDGGQGGARVYELDGIAAVSELNRLLTAYHDAGHITDTETFHNTISYLQTYFNQLPTPPLLRLAYVNRVVAMNDPAEYYWDVISEVANVTDVYHIFFVGNQAQLIDDGEGIALAYYFDGISTSYTPPGGTPVTSTPVAPRPLINHFMCGAAANFSPIVASPITDDLSRKITVDSNLLVRTQLYYPDSPTGVIPDPNAPTDPTMDTAVDFYANALSSAVVAQLCSGSRFNRAPGALSTANLSQLRGVTTVGSRTDYAGMRDQSNDLVPYTPPNIAQVQQSSSTERNLLFYVQTAAPSVQFTFRLGSTPNEDENGVPPRYLDQTVAIDWLETTIIQEYLNLVVQRGSIPYTTSGFNIIRTVIEKVFERGKRLDILNPRFGPADGEIIIVPTAEDATPMQRQSRETPPILFVTQLSERVNRVTINGTVQP